LLCKYKRNEAHFVSLLTEKEKKKEKRKHRNYIDRCPRTRALIFSFTLAVPRVYRAFGFSFFFLPPPIENERETERESREIKS